MALTEREQAIVALLRRDPTITSAGIAHALGSTRTAVNVHLSNLGKKGVIRGRGYVLSEPPGVVVIGGANVDVKARSTASAAARTSNPGTASMSPGGVARNIAENLARLGTRTHLLATVGVDAMGDGLLTQTAAAGVRVELVRRSARPTGTYTAVLDADGELLLAVADMSATDDLDAAQLDAAREVISSAGLLVLDGNLAPATLGYALELATAAQVAVVLDPVSVPKAARISAELFTARPVFALTPNRDELAALTGRAARTDRQVVSAAQQLHERGVTHVWVRLGTRGSILSTAGAGHTVLPALAAEVVDVTGAGDAMLAAFCHAVLAGQPPVAAARYGSAAAALTVASAHTVRPDLTARLVETALARMPRSTP